MRGNRYVRLILVVVLIVTIVAMWVACTRSVSYYSHGLIGGRQFVCRLRAGSLLIGTAPAGLYIPGLQTNDPALPVRFWIDVSIIQGTRIQMIPLWMPLALCAFILGWSWKKPKQPEKPEFPAPTTGPPSPGTSGSSVPQSGHSERSASLST